MKTAHKYKGINYYCDYKDARDIRNILKPAYPEARIVSYLRGYAIQYQISGSYYPEGKQL